MLLLCLVALAVEGWILSVQIGFVFTADVRLGTESVHEDTVELFFELAERPAVATLSSIAASAGRLPADIAIDGASQKVFPVALAVLLHEPSAIRLEKLFAASGIDEVMQMSRQRF